VPATRLVETKPWSRADQMAAERENFGFYFAAHPVEEYRAVAAPMARGPSSLMAGAGEAGAQRRGDGRDGGERPEAQDQARQGLHHGRFLRQQRAVLGLVLRGGDDSFQWAREGTCVLLNVELDRPNADEPPRVTVARVRSPR
jgi:DNA polymerase-3 subunit alpha